MKLVTILCCINPVHPTEQITEFTFCQMLSPFTKVMNVKIFERGSQIKAFVQVQNKEQADLVIKEVDGKHMNIGKAKVFMSHKKYISFDKSIAQIKAEAKTGKTAESRIFPKEPVEQTNPYAANFFNSFQSNPGNMYIKSKVNQSKVTKSPPQSSVISREISDSDQSGKRTLTKRKTSSGDMESYSFDQDFVKENRSPDENKHCVRISNVDFEKVCPKKLLNLFGCFGNVSKLLVQKEQGFTVVLFENKRQVNAAIMYADCIRFFGRILSVESYEGFNFFELAYQSEDNFELYINNPAEYRYQLDYEPQIVQPSKYLMLKGLPPDTETSAIEEFLGTIYRPMNIWQEKGLKNNIFTYIAVFKTINEAVMVLSALHNSDFEGYNVTLSFLRKKKCLFA